MLLRHSTASWKEYFKLNFTKFKRMGGGEGGKGGGGRGEGGKGGGGGGEGGEGGRKEKFDDPQK